MSTTWYTNKSSTHRFIIVCDEAPSESKRKKLKKDGWALGNFIHEDGQWFGVWWKPKSAGGVLRPPLVPAVADAATDEGQLVLLWDQADWGS